MSRPKKAITGSQVVVPERARAARDAAGLSQPDAAFRAREISKAEGREVKIAAAEISRLENGVGFDILGSKLRVLALAYGCSTDYLLGMSSKLK